MTPYPHTPRQELAYPARLALASSWVRHAVGLAVLIARETTMSEMERELYMLDIVEALEHAAAQMARAFVRVDADE